jgi:hypothetical protein
MGGKHDRSGFIVGRDHLEQRIGPALVDAQLAQLIEQEQAGTDIRLEHPAQQVVDLSRHEMIDHVLGPRMADRVLSALNGRIADSLRYR